MARPTSKAVANRAWLALTEGRREGVEHDLRRAIEGFDRSAGRESRAAIMAQSLLGGLLKEEGRLDEAEALFTEILPEPIAVLGPEAPETLVIQNNLAALHALLGDRPAAILELEALLAARRRLLGVRHQETAMTASNLASLYFFEERYEEASPLFAAALEALALELPPEHPSILTLRVNLGANEMRRGSPETAAPHLRAVLYRPRGLPRGEPRAHARGALRARLRWSTRSGTASAPWSSRRVGSS